MKRLVLAIGLIVCAPAFAAEAAWDDIRHALYGERFLLDGSGLIAIDVPYRTSDDARTDIAALVTAPAGTELREITLILDENPMPVSAVFQLATAPTRFFFDVTMRINGPTPLHVVARTTDGRLFVAETFVKTTGQGACSAPPGTDAELALQTLGEMRIELAGRVPDNTCCGSPSTLTQRLNQIDVTLDHPSHSGMQMDQVSLLFTPMRYIETLDIGVNGGGYARMTGSISLSENPRIGLSVPSGTQSVDVTMTDTGGTITHAHKTLEGY
ncbi:sulfur-oxidizing protein SoxY [Rhodovulum imhoffii]|uniref:Sulfur-oxidizing protein SoxY n=1 Tax=Rhodovulum imhoffii TaxID=365340 RepID=A0A2T5BWL8_9RHOB|nr:quinoprotein dehydrogenase-associated SoxYZ-like carrier [Rhodovulum imhoffii]MBK5933307.1 quinoprotein dehydrogenase-associated SoxYZ-like carrier [Rhodovulum imhoffii]PTN04065.1 sulfur-oxidizing protein SoxY [Rhodovulum imhoffii]